jgi:hypothetical protein
VLPLRPQIKIGDADLCLEAQLGDEYNGSPVQARSGCAGGDNQLFALEVFGDAYRLRVKHSRRCLDIGYEGEKLQQWECLDERASQSFKPAAGGWQAPAGGACLCSSKGAVMVRCNNTAAAAAAARAAWCAGRERASAACVRLVSGSPWVDPLGCTTIKMHDSPLTPFTQCACRPPLPLRAVAQLLPARGSRAGVPTKARCSQSWTAMAMECQRASSAIQRICSLAGCSWGALVGVSAAFRGEGLERPVFVVCGELAQLVPQLLVVQEPHRHGMSGRFPLGSVSVWIGGDKASWMPVVEARACVGALCTCQRPEHHTLRPATVRPSLLANLCELVLAGTIWVVLGKP